MIPTWVQQVTGTPTPPPTGSFLLLEDDVSYILLEDDVSKIILE